MGNLSQELADYARSLGAFDVTLESSGRGQKLTGKYISENGDPSSFLTFVPEFDGKHNTAANQKAKIKRLMASRQKEPTPSAAKTKKPKKKNKAIQKPKFKPAETKLNYNPFEVLAELKKPKFNPRTLRLNVQECNSHVPRHEVLRIRGKAEVEVVRLKRKGWTRKDFANALNKITK